jgi:hypothetical protein
VSAVLPGSERLRGVEPGADRMLRGVESDVAYTLRVETVFRVADERHAQTVAAKLIDRVHEIANLPECECDVDVSVQVASDEGGARISGAR